MASRSLGLRSHVNYLVYRVRNLNAGSVVERAREVSRQFGKPVATVVADMYWQAAFHKVGFQDYVDYDFAMLTRAERKTFMTHPISNAISQKYDHPDYRHLFHDKFAFVREFSDLLGRDWMMLDAGNADELAAFMATHPTIITKRQTGQAGSAITRYTIDDVDDAAAFHRGLLERGELLIEENIVQHPDLAAVCPGTVNSTRIAAFFDGEKTHILAMAQKFGRGQAADQMDFGGFYTMLDEHGKAMGDGYDSHGHVWERHPDTCRCSRRRSTSSVAPRASCRRCSTSDGMSRSPRRVPCSSRATGARVSTRSSPRSSAAAPVTARATVR